MSDKERTYSKVLEQLEQGQLVRREAARLMGCTERHVTRLRKAYRERGDAGLVHGLRGQPSSRGIGPRLLAQALDLVAERYAGFGPTLAAEKLAERHGLVLSAERLRQAMIGAGLWKRTPRKARARQWRERRPCFGELVQMDSSEHDWFEGRGEKATLILMIDDATSHAHMRFAPADTGEASMQLLSDYMRCHGRPRALYTDKASHFVVNRAPDLTEQLAGQQAQTQIGRALCELGIELILAHSPQAKGRVERCFGTAQDRLVKELRLRGVSSIAAANHLIAEYYLPWWNEHKTVPPACQADAHRSLEGFDLEAILSHHEQRQVQNDHTISYRGQRYQVLPESQRANLRKRTVTIQRRLDGSVRAWDKDQYLELRPLPPGAAPAAPAVGLRPPSGAAADPPPASRQGPSNPNSPWRKQSSRRYLFGPKETFSPGSQRDISTLR